MGLGGISIWQLLIILVIVVMLFGTKRLRSLGGDLGSAIKGFKKAVSDEEQKDKEQQAEQEKLVQTKQQSADDAAAKSSQPADKTPDQKV